MNSDIIVTEIYKLKATAELAEALESELQVEDPSLDEVENVLKANAGKLKPQMELPSQ